MRREALVSFRAVVCRILNENKAYTHHRWFTEKKKKTLKDANVHLLPRMLKRHNNQIQNCCFLPTLLLTKPIVKVSVARSLFRKSGFCNYPG